MLKKPSQIKDFIDLFSVATFPIQSISFFRQALRWGGKNAEAQRTQRFAEEKPAACQHGLVSAVERKNLCAPLRSLRLCFSAFILLRFDYMGLV